MKLTADMFAAAGGVFITSPTVLGKRLDNIKAYIFDWDGVFNAGHKGGGIVSTFSEADSVGTNLLRFSHYLEKGELPICAIITGQQNPAAEEFAKREHFNTVYYHTLHKIDAARDLCKRYNISINQVAFFFDDVLDISLAREAGFRIFLQRKNGLLFNEYVRSNQLADYFTAQDGGNYGIREACEMMILLRGNDKQTINGRVEFEGIYEKYLGLRNALETTFYSRKTGVIEEVK